MNLTDSLSGDIALAMKARDAIRLTALRMLKTALTNKSIEKGRALEPAEELQMIATLVKQRRDSIEQFTNGGREDLAVKERAEIDILNTFLPPAVTQDEIDAAVVRAIAETGASTPRDMGKVMKATLDALAGKTVDGKQVSEAVRTRLAG